MPQEKLPVTCSRYAAAKMRNLSDGLKVDTMPLPFLMWAFV
ncbi:hypothetical protein JCM19232_4211 [Vibrio ishigakensis]|uniref:Uncharacterized protein n=1 Tax=Vibrio ishigakensis TaxID=1481914 RepID=A0A0B8PFZ3_9VIBR|nr:hypothetical protein JCM19232_4211 [Vibrio ishigakensis]